jgi:hypothetical protein
MTRDTTEANQGACNGYYENDQILRAADAAHAAMRERYPKQLYTGIHLTNPTPDGEVASPAIRAFLSSLLADPPSTGRHLFADEISDEHIVGAATEADAEGMVSLSFTDRQGNKKPTSVIDEFLLHLFTRFTRS